MMDRKNKKNIYEQKSASLYGSQGKGYRDSESVIQTWCVEKDYDESLE